MTPMEKHVFEENTRRLFALEELSIGAWPQEMCVAVFHLNPNAKPDDPLPAPRIVPPYAVQGLFRIFNAKMDEIAPAARRAMEAYYDQDGLKLQIKKMQAVVDAAKRLEDDGYTMSGRLGNALDDLT